MIGVNESKVSVTLLSAFSIVKNMLSEPHEIEQEYKTLPAEQLPDDVFDEIFNEPEYTMSQEELQGWLRGERTPIVDGMSKPRIVAAAVNKTPELNEYQQHLVDSQGRDTTGLYYIPKQTWSDVDSVITYLDIVDKMSLKEWEDERKSTFYRTMMKKLHGLMVDDNKTLDSRMRLCKYHRGLALATKQKEGGAIIVDLPSGKRITFDQL